MTTMMHAIDELLSVLMHALGSTTVFTEGPAMCMTLLQVVQHPVHGHRHGSSVISSSIVVASLVSTVRHHGNSMASSTAQLKGTAL